MANNWLPYALMGGSSLLGNLGQSTNQEFSQTPGDAFLQNLLGPMMQQGIGAGMSGQPLYPTMGYTSPEAPFSSPMDFLQRGEVETSQNIFNNMLSSGGFGSGRGGVSGAGFGGAERMSQDLATGAMGRYTQMQGLYDQMGAQAGQFNAGAMNQSYGAPWNLAGMYPGSTGNQIVQQQSNPWADAASSMMGMYGMNQMFGGGSPFSGASAGAGASGAGAGAGWTGGTNAALFSGGGPTGPIQMDAGLKNALGGYSGAPSTGLSAFGASGNAASGVQLGAGYGAGMAAAAYNLGPIAKNVMIPAMKSISHSLGMGQQTAPGAGNYLNALQGGADQYGGENSAIQNMFANSTGVGTNTPERQIQTWMAMQKYGQYQAEEGGGQSPEQWLNQIPMSEVQALIAKYNQGQQPVSYNQQNPFGQTLIPA